MASSLDDEGLATFERARPRLFGVVYRVLGSVSESEDIVQEVWFRWQLTARDEVRDPPAFLATAAARLALNAAQSARARREKYMGRWLPEPVDTCADPALGAERGEALALAVLLLLEKLTPAERAAYVLREAFGYEYERIADIVKTSELNARKLVSRARRRVLDERRAPASQSDHQRLLAAFVAAARRGDVAALEQVFAADVVSNFGGGGFARAARIPVVGRGAVAKFVATVTAWLWTGAALA